MLSVLFLFFWRCSLCGIDFDDLGMSICNHKERHIFLIPKKYIFGLIFLLLGWMTLEAIIQTRPDPVWSNFSNVFENTFEILFDSMPVRSGLIGGLLLGIFGSLFDYTGTYLVVGLFFVLAICLFGYDYFIKREKKEKPKQKREEERNQD